MAAKTSTLVVPYAAMSRMAAITLVGLWRTLLTIGGQGRPSVFNESAADLVVSSGPKRFGTNKVKTAVVTHGSIAWDIVVCRKMNK